MPQAIAWENWPADIARVIALVSWSDCAPALTACRPLVLQSIRDNFTSSASASDVTWPPRKRAGDGHPLLMETGALLQAATGGGPGHVSRVSRDTLELGVDKSVRQGGIPGAGVHMFGYARRNIPARPYLGLRERYAARCGDLIADHVLALVEGRP